MRRAARRRRGLTPAAACVLGAVAAALAVASAFLGTPSFPGKGAASTQGASSGEAAEVSLSGEAEAVLSRAEGSGYVFEQGIEAAAGKVLESYAAREGCALARSGYLGILGDCWGCVVTGGDWAEVCVVTQRADEERSEVRIWRIDAAELEGLEADGAL